MKLIINMRMYYILISQFTSQINYPIHRQYISITINKLSKIKYIINNRAQFLLIKIILLMMERLILRMKNSIFIVCRK